MPALYSRKPYVENGIYHIFNRGVEKRKIFIDDQDYRVFMNILKEHLLPKKLLLEELRKHKKDPWCSILIEKRISYYGKINLFGFVLMPNHFHLQLRQVGNRTITGFMKSIQIRYSLYFNKKYNRVGPLFQGRYRGILIQNELYLLTISRYIHRNPLSILGNGAVLSAYPYSSYSTYCGEKSLIWIDIEPIITMFDPLSRRIARQRYLDFVEEGE